jgi:hypothetical protein
MSKLLTDALLEEAQQLAQQLQDDIRLASTRIEHVRLTARANEAALLAERLKELNTNDVDAEATS